MSLISRSNTYDGIQIINLSNSLGNPVNLTDLIHSSDLGDSLSSYVTVSEKMNEIFKKMYSTKKNNKPTIKAKRLKAKLEKWKKYDEKHFDTNMQNNPVDVIDLSEFILK